MNHQEKLQTALYIPSGFTKEAWAGTALRAAFGGLKSRAPAFLKGKLSVPFRNAAGAWSRDTGKAMSNVSKYVGGAFKETPDILRRAQVFGDDLSRFGLRQKGVADTIWKPSNYKGWNKANPLNPLNSIARNAVGAGLIMSPVAPLYYGPGMLTGGLMNTAYLGMEVPGLLGKATGRGGAFTEKLMSRVKPNLRPIVRNTNLLRR